MSEFSISVNIADRSYPMTIDRKEEEVVRKAAKSINQLIKLYSDNYAFKDKQDLLAMVAIHYTTSALNNEIRLSKGDTELITRLTEMDTLLSEFE